MEARADQLRARARDFFAQCPPALRPEARLLLDAMAEHMAAVERSAEVWRKR